MKSKKLRSPLKETDALSRAHAAIEMALPILKHLSEPLDSRNDYTVEQIDEAVCGEAKNLIRILKRGLSK